MIPWSALLASQSRTASSAKVSGFHLTTLLRSGVFISISVPFALGLTAQVGFLTHQIGFLSPSIGTIAAGWAVSLTTFAAVLGRIAIGYIADQFDRRAVACANFIVQMLGMAILATATTPVMLYLGCVLFASVSGIRHRFLACWCSRNFRSSISPGSSA